ncbi:putative disease resistance protein RGA1 [Humulus lupulus]|uniref:putative disease resistance protein RGA1 n=1 Tax=Humulus lupulus TaxID=3486 RepID=UPI002B403545|nr:putative disease resistance protein RGA1 [Humulus lupulus]
MRLNNLRGDLEVINLSHEKDVATEYGSAELKDKKYLRSLTLEWDSHVEIDEAEAIVGYEMSMEGLQPHENLLELTLTNYGGVKVSTWLSSLTNLVNLTLKDCKKCEYLVSLNQFHCLKVLNLQNLESIELPNLKGWWREIVISGEEDEHISLPCLPSLSKLKIQDCARMTCLPLYPHLEQLTLENNLKPLEETLRMKMMMSSTAASSFFPLSKLKTLRLTKIENLECLLDWFESLTSSLNKLYIWDCPKLKDLCLGILHLSSLRNLWIEKCEGLADMLNGDDGIMWKALNGRLHSLQLWFCQI